MPRRKGMIGPGAGAMGGPGMKPSRPPTAAAGRPPPTRTPGASPLVGAPGPSPGGIGGGMGGGGMGGPPRGGGIGGAAGFKKGGESEKSEKKYARGGMVEGMKEGSKAEEKGESFAERKREGEKGMKFEKGGEVKGRVGRDTAHASKSC